MITFLTKPKFVTAILATVIVISSMMTTSTANAQANGLSVVPSNGRVNSTTLNLNNYSYDALKIIRDLIDEEEYEAAANRSITFIRSRESDTRSGIDRTPLFKEAYNSLCVSATALGKVEYAMDTCNKSLKLAPHHWESLKSRAILNFLTKDYENSLRDFKMALDNAPDNQAIRDALQQNISIVESK